MASRVLSIEIGQGLTRVAEIDYKVKNPKIYNIFSLTTPPDMINDGKVTVNDVFVSQLANALRNHSIGTKKVVFVMNSARVANRIIQIPFVKENRIADLLNANASDYFPVDMDQYQLTHEVMGTIEDAGDKKLQLSVLAVPKDMIESYRELAVACSLSFEGLDYMGNSIKKMMVKEIPEEIKATLKVEENSSVLTVIEDGQVKLQRTINYGVGDAIDSTIESQVFGYAIDALEAVNELSRRTCMFYSFDKMETSSENIDGSVDKEKLQALRVEITEGFRTLIGSTSRILDYYQSQNPDKKIEKIYLVGLGSVISGLSRLMTNELSYKVVANQQYTDISLAKNAQDEAIHIAEYFTTIGAALDPISIDANDKKAEKAAKAEGGAPAANDSLLGSILICVLSLVGAIALAVFGIMNLTSVKSENKRLHDQVESLAYAEDTYAQYQQVLSDYTWATGVDEAVYSPNNELVAFIGELEQKMPSDIIVFNFNAARGGVSLDVQVSSKEAVADVIAQLRTFATVNVESISSITETEEEGASTVSFSVELSYNNATAEPAAEN